MEYPPGARLESCCIRFETISRVSDGDALACLFYGFQWIPKVTGSILLDCILLGMGSKPAAVRVFRMGSSMALLGSLLVLESAKGAGQETCFCFIWIPKVTESILSDCILRGMGSNPAAVRVFAWASPRHPLLEACWCWRLPRVPANRCLCFMVS